MKPKKKRLALFLDGTWNTEDDSTNVYHAYSLTKYGSVENDTIDQKRYYDPGVGTGILDSVTGGGFGLGLDKNVRQAYNWLVDQYEKGDEIYIFGFSRGAYTARSLMGFMAACGLIKRGAPINISQLWSGYVFTSVNRDQKDFTWWKDALGKPKNQHKFRRINKFQKTEEEKKVLTADELKETAPINDTERLLGNWSRRVDITYMGIFDTVGAMGWEALALPGLTSKLDTHHNPYPSKILKKCRHALAIDENRTSFKLTRLENFIENDKTYEQACEYDSHIKQRWFVGAHSNIGGGYPNNVLAARPLEWILEGARKAADGKGLIVKGYEQNKEAETFKIESCADEVRKEAKSVKSAVVDNKRKPKISDIVDSYADFAGGLWANVIRAKRHLRPIMRPDLLQQSHALHSISEEIDETVEAFIEENNEYAPANLAPYVNEKASPKIKEAFFSNLQNKVAAEFSIRSQTILVLWCVMAAIGIQGYLYFFFGGALNVSATSMAVIAFLYVLVNWGEHWANLELTYKPTAVIPQLQWNFLMWIRLLGILLFFIGAIIFVKRFVEIGLDAKTWESYWPGIRDVFSDWWPVPLAALSAAIPIYWLKGKDKIADLAKTTIGVAFFSLLVLAAVGGTVAFLAAVFSFLSGPETAPLEYGNNLDKESQTEIIAGYVLFILLLYAILLGGLKWVRNPMGPARANLGSISKLQWAYSTSGITNLFAGWEGKLSRPRDGYDDDECKRKAWLRVKAILHETVWSDYLGFIPVYTLVLGLILWIGFSLADPTHLTTPVDPWFLPEFLSGSSRWITKWLLFPEFWTSGPGPNIQWWQALLGITVFADLIENWAHLSHLDRYRNGGISAGATILGFAANLIKTIGFVILLLLSIFIALKFILIVLTFNDGRWRWMLATGILYFVIVTVVLAFVNSRK